MLYRCSDCGSFYPVYAPTCSWCLASHTFVLAPERKRAAHDGEIELTSARDLAKATWQTTSLPAYPDLALRRGALVVLVGPAGAGKSTMMTRGLDSTGAPALLVSVEEPAGPSLAERLARVGCKRDDLYVCSRGSVDQIAGLVKQNKICWLGIDSAQRAMFEARDLRHLLLTLPSLLGIVCTSQINRQHEPRGGEELGHEADVLVECEAMTWRVTKSRYQPAGTGGDVLPPMRSTPPPSGEVTAHVGP
jgi:hypothetical protein